MRNFLAVARKELHTLFVSPVAYVVLTIFFLVSGYFFYAILTTIIEGLMQQAMQAQQFGMPSPPRDVPSLVMRSFFGVISTVLLFLVPMITMATFADEKRRGTVELLFTSPLTNTQLILGKFTGVLIFFFIMLVPTKLNVLLLYLFSDPPPPLSPLLVGYLGAFLLGGSLLAFGVFVSSLTENQIVAAVGTFGLFLILWVLDALAGASSTLVNETLRYLSVLNHYEDFTRGVLDTQHLVFYLSLVGLGLFLTSVSLDSVKWRS